METQLFTFGHGHTFGGGSYVSITAESKRRCREIMHHTFGEKWSMQYDAESKGKLIECGMVEVMALSEDEQKRITFIASQRVKVNHGGIAI